MEGGSVAETNGELPVRYPGLTPGRGIRPNVPDDVSPHRDGVSRCSRSGGGGTRQRLPFAAPPGIHPGRVLVRSAFLVAAVLGPGFSVSGVAGAADGSGAPRDDLSGADLRRVRAVTAPATDFSRPEPYERMAGGAATSLALVNSNAFSHPSANLTFEGRRDFALGNGLFRKVWVTAPASTRASDGLGPLFNARACQRCHIKDGRGHPPRDPDDLATSMLLRLSVPPRSAGERLGLESKVLAFHPEPTYGSQLQDFAVPGLPAEGKMNVAYETVPVELNGGEKVSLRRPAYAISNLGYGPMEPDVMLSPRVAPPMIGLGLLEAVHPADIVAGADPDDADGDGVSGRPSVGRDAGAGSPRLGRFGWKASTATLREQSARAFSADIGISNPDAPDPWGDCTEAQVACRSMPSGVQRQLGDTEAPAPVLDLVAFYSSNLAVPARREVGDPEVLRGKALFHSAGCASCHTPKFVTRRDAARPEHRFQLIWPYTDLLLHDMGEGLADDRPVGNASGREWRTAPLWGIGLTGTVSGHTFFLHDGRARSLLEAVLWHGGEGQASRDAVVAMRPAERRALLRFLNSL